ncbi:MAG: carbamoyl-phosphate synthase large subunit [Bacteroidetes bacterium HLUCCA01]|nr:MAG: carbamoyl-phosphate synthase large subunit [Bacteroidetes bacterium HLUCCA01]
MKKYTIAISCIGSGVGQSVINSLKLSQLPLKTIGFGTNPFAYGAYDCDAYDYTPNIYSDGYVDKLIEKCKKYNVDLVIPGLDDEALIFAQNEEKFQKANIKAIYADEELISLCRDKERMSRQLNKIVDVFVKSYDKETLHEDIKSGKVQFPFIAKPRGGFASKGIEIILNKDDLGKINQDHIIQELAIPHKNDPNREYYLKQIEQNKNPQVSEISIQLVYGPDSELMGRMASFNKLNNGIPIEVLPYDDENVWEIIDQLSPELLKMGLRGPINIQGRLTDKGLKLFEMNPRFTGITGLRALMGFNEVEACVKEWLGIDKGKNILHFNHTRFGMRQTADKSVPIVRSQKVSELSEKLEQDYKPKEKKVLITGATGYLGQNLINKLSRIGGFEIWAYGRNKGKTKEALKEGVKFYYDKDDLEKGNIHFGNIDILLHMGFARPHKSNHEVAESLKFTNKLFTRAAMNHVPAVINVSTQSVYGLETEPLWSEEDLVYPSTPYAQAKYASELILESLKSMNNQFCFTSIRLGTLAGGAKGLVETDLLTKMTQQALKEKSLYVIGGQQQMERLDIRDAVDGITRLLDINPENYEPVYNFGSGETHLLIDIANKIAEKTGKEKVSVNLEDSEDIQMKFGMDSSKFYETVNWKPQRKLDDTIESLIDYLS